LRDLFPADSLTPLKESATRCFEAAGKGLHPLNPFSNSLLLTTLTDFGCASDALMAPLSAPGLEQLFSEALGCDWICSLEQSWVRKKLAPHEPRSPQYHPQDWHQDGALGVQFPPQPGPVIPMTRLLTCWIPLNPCGRHSPGLEFIPRPQPALLHFTELNDPALRQRFGTEQFWAPELEFGDGLVFLNSVLHRTYTLPEMQQSRLSVEYRIFPR
jgi:hypothetical protein